MENRHKTGLGILAVVIVIAAIWIFTSITYATEGTRVVAVKWGRLENVIAPDDGFEFLLTPGWDTYEINIKSFTQTAAARVTSKDNAAIQVDVSVTGATNGSKETIAEYVRAFGFVEADRHKRRDQILAGIIQTEARNAFAEYGAYEIYANQEAIQKRLFESIKVLAEPQLMIRVDSVQLGNPDFLDDRIEQAAASVVANQKEKEAALALLDAAKINNERKVLDAATYANPQAFSVKKMEMQLEQVRLLSDGIAKHQGPLYLDMGGGSGGLQLNAQVAKE